MNKVQFQKGYSLFEFMHDYGTEAQCEEALLAWRFPQGLICSDCGNRPTDTALRRALAKRLSDDRQSGKVQHGVKAMLQQT